MNKESFQKAQEAALSKVYEDIAQTGKPTEAQLAFIKMVEPKKTAVSEFEDAGKVFMSMMGFMEGK